MAQNVTVAGASYSDVPSVVLPKTGGGSATFLDTTITSNAASASDIASGKYAYVNGSLVEGTGSGGGGGGLDYPWLTSSETITIGANSITNMQQAQTYFSSYTPYYIAALKTAPDTYNQVVTLAVNGATALRYRNGTISGVTMSSVYDAKLVEGTQYEIYHF